MDKTPRGIRAECSHSYATLESVALHFRNEIGLKDPVTPVLGLALYDKIQDIPLEVEGKEHRIFCRIDKLPDGLEAKALYSPDSGEFGDYEIVLTERTYAQLEGGHPRGKSGLIHECSHVVLHPHLLRKLNTLPIHSRAALYRGDRKAHEFFWDTEWQADALTGAISMPARGIEKLSTEFHPGMLDRIMPGAIAAHYKVSEQAAGYRWDIFKKRRSDLLKARPAHE